MVHSVIFYSFTVICASILLDGSLKVYGLEKPFDHLEARAEELLKDIAAFTNAMQEGNQDIIQARDEAITDVVQESKDSVKEKLEKAKSEGKDVSQCQEVADSKTSEFITMAENKMAPCLDSFRNELKAAIIKVESVGPKAQKIAEEIKAAAEKCSAKTLTPEESNRCTEQNVASLKTAIDDLNGEALEASYGRLPYLLEVFKQKQECSRETANGLISILKTIEIDVDRCVAAAKTN